jgi:mono/diheme cytochrome c family protein
VVVVAFVLIYQFDPLRADTLTLTVPAIGELTPVHASASTETVAASAQVDAAPNSLEVSLGQQLYAANCAACHGADGEGIDNLGSSLAGSAVIQADDAEVLAFIRAGRPADDPANTTGIAMPPSGGHPELDDSDMLAIVAFLRAL